MKSLHSQFETPDDGRLFSDALLAGAQLNDADTQAFREAGTKHTLQDPFYKDSITVYRKDDGTVMVDSFQPANSPVSPHQPIR